MSSPIARRESPTTAASAQRARGYFAPRRLGLGAELLALDLQLHEVELGELLVVEKCLPRLHGFIAEFHQAVEHLDLAFERVNVEVGSANGGDDCVALGQQRERGLIDLGRRDRLRERELLPGDEGLRELGNVEDAPCPVRSPISSQLIARSGFG